MIEELVHDRIVKKTIQKVALEINRTIEKSRDLIEKNFVKSRARILRENLDKDKRQEQTKEMTYGR